MIDNNGEFIHKYFFSLQSNFFFSRATAAKYYEQSGNNSQAYQCYALTEDYVALEKLSNSLQENDPLLKVKRIFVIFLSYLCFLVYWRYICWCWSN